MKCSGVHCMDAHAHILSISMSKHHTVRPSEAAISSAV